MATISRELLVQAIEEQGGIVTAVARTLQISRPTVYALMERHGVSRDFLNEARQQTADMAEESLRALLKDRNPTATIFALKTLGRSRGYVEQVDNSHLLAQIIPTLVDKLTPAGS